jgi:hypothetical protein
MKKKLGVLVLTLSALVISAACASSGPSTETKSPQSDGELSGEIRPSELPNRPADATAVQTASLGR